MLCTTACQGKYVEAEPLLYERSQARGEKVLGLEHPDVHVMASVLRQSYSSNGLEPLEKELGPEHPDVATTLNNRAGLLANQGKYIEAEPLYERSQAIREKVLGPEHSILATLNNRACFFGSQGKYIKAEPLFERSQGIQEKVLGPEHPGVATTLNNRAPVVESRSKSWVVRA
ncbi:unnamed protein product [Ectocarpus sp. CCAP 1310/34]|nr:unnamed protein product [Ectocarpus sp. CCAP 1310/34]